MPRIFIGVVASVAGLLAAAPNRYPIQSETAEVFALGVVIPRVVTLVRPQQSYALYLPAKYAREKRWPTVYVFDPLARGQLALEQFQHAAETHGFIVAASNNSRNGPWAPEFEAAEAMVSDTQQRFSVDPKRVYFAGFSGGARVASQLAQLCKCSAGVLLSGAGFSRSSPPSLDFQFAVFSTVGNADFNYSELVPLQDALQKAALPHWLRVFEGPHEWAPAKVLDEALAWFRVQSMKSQREPRDDAYLSAQFTTAQESAAAYEPSGDLLAAWREYQQITATFESLRDVSAVRTKAAELEKARAVRDAMKHEKDDFEEQERLSSEILAATFISNRQDSPEIQSTARADLQARDLRLRAAGEKKPQRALVLRRALAGIFIGSMESGGDALDKKDYGRASRQFACATEANRDSEWAFRNLAVARALSSDGKGAIEALRAARKITKDVAAFSDWLSQEHAFDGLRPAADFRSLKDNH